jgi:hypothetical protein
MKALIEGEDYYPDKTGLFVFTEKYLLQRGTCCGNARPNGSSGRGCGIAHTNYKNVPEPKRSKLLSLRQDEKVKTYFT